MVSGIPSCEDEGRFHTKHCAPHFGCNRVGADHKDQGPKTAAIIQGRTAPAARILAGSERWRSSRGDEDRSFTIIEMYRQGLIDKPSLAVTRSSRSITNY